ncbi:MAG TPA: translocation/assembly module TamB domain-containing protein, partial [Longimicrobiales bacterium]
MNARANRSEWPTVLGSFLVGLIIALGLVGIWIMLTSGSKETFNLTVAARDTTAARNEGLIGTTYTRIAQRVRAERTVVRPVRGNLRFRAADIVWTDPGRPAFIHASEMRGQLDTRAAGNGDIVVRGLSINGGDVYAEENAPEQWNYRRVMAQFFEPREPDAPSRTFLVTDIAIQNVNVRIKQLTRSFEFRNVAAQLPRAEFAGPRLPEPRVVVARATGTLVAGDSTYGVSAEDARLAFPTGRVDFTVARLQTGATHLTNLAGTWGGNLPGYALQMTGVVESMRFQDVHFLSKRVPATGTASFGFAVRPVNDRLTEVSLSNAQLESQGSHVTGSATVQFGDSAFAVRAIDARFQPLALALVEQILGDTLPYQGSIAGTARGTDGLVTFDVSTRLSTREVREPFVTRFTGTARLASGEFEVRALEATLRDAPLSALRAIMPGLPLKGTVSGRIALRGPPGKAPLNVDVRVELANGVAIVEGRVDLTGAVPSYDVSGRLLAIDVQQLLKPDVPPVFLTAHFSAAGSGLDPNTAVARVHLEGRFTGWQTGAHDTLHLAARLERGSVRVDSAALRLATMTATADGVWRFVAPTAGAISYRVAFEPITPFGRYIPVIGDEDAVGNIALTGRVTGERGNMHAAANLNGSNIAVGDWGASALGGNVDLVIGPAIPQVDVAVSARDLRTPTAGAYQTATATVRLQSPTFALDVRATRANSSGGLEIVADGRIPPTGAREVILHRARIDFGSDNWSLIAPAVFSWAAPGSDLTVRGFEMRKSDGTGMIRLEGRVAPLANADFRLETRELPVGDIQRLLGREPVISGELSTTTSIRAVNGVPQLTMRFQVDSAVVEAVHFSQLAGDASYLNQKLVANAKAFVDTAGALELHADVPVELRLGAGGTARLLESGPVRITLVSDSIALAPFGVLHPAIDKLAGSLAANITVTGTVQEPLLAGTLSLRNAALTVLPANQRFDSINATIALENRRAVIRDLVARAGGLAHVSGSIEFQDLTKPVLDLTTDLDRFHAVGVDNQHDAEISGRVRLAGPMRAAVLTGSLTMADGYFPVPQAGGSALDAELAQFEPDVSESPEPPPTPFFSGLVIDGLRLRVGPNLWFAMPDAKAELEGELTIDKHGADTRIVGDLEGERGTYTLRAGPIIRRFNVVHANVRFLGGRELNPALDIIAERNVIEALSGRQLNIQVHVGGTLQSPTLALASEDAATIPQSELLSFLLFGQPSFAFGGNPLTTGQQVLEETVGGG